MASDHLGLLCDVGELSASLAGSTDVGNFLQKIVTLVARHMQSEVCSIYVYDLGANELVLHRTHGLNPDKVGAVRMSIDEGLVGMALRELRAIRVEHASAHPNYKHFHGFDESMYESFLAVPIRRGLERIGVLVVQRQEARAFSRNDEMALQATAAQLASAIENARALMSMHQTEPKLETGREPLEVVRGKIASEGFGMGNVVVINHNGGAAGGFRDLAYTGHYGAADFERAVLDTERQLQDLQERLTERLPEVAALIFSAQILMLKDPQFVGRMREQVMAGMDPVPVVANLARGYIDRLLASPVPFMRERAQDVEDVTKRLIGNIRHDLHEPGANCHGRIVLADTLYPSDILKLASEDAAGILMMTGGVTAHVSILARSMQIPLLIANKPRLLELPESTFVVLDCLTGVLYVEPAEEVLQRLRDQAEAKAVKEHHGAQMLPETHTADGVSVKLLANINVLSDLGLAGELKAEGVGLYRSEFPFLIRNDFPSEEEQVPIYQALIEQMPGRELTFRTLDIGGDKVMAYYEDADAEPNPHLGLRSIRFSLRHPGIFREQIRAFLRASVVANGRTLRLMFPMISSKDELLEARRHVVECIEELTSEGLEGMAPVQIGIMVEVPSLVEILDDLAPAVDFFCVGTNDFIQFLLAVDRGNERVAPYFLPYHPAVLRSLKRIADIANRHGVDVSICGEMAHEVQYIPFLIGVGFRTLSIDPRFLPQVQQKIMGLRVRDAKAHAARVLSLDTIELLKPFFVTERDESPCAADTT